jgi:tetratricopeptide (TPR) repeat protein
MNIEAINGWFFDDKTARGVSFDGFLPQACKTPLGNMPLGNMPLGNTPEFELIHTPEKMADFQNNDWYRKNWKLGDTLLTFSPLQPDKHILVDAYRKEMAKILSFPCDSEYCKHDASCGAGPTRRSCRGLSTLRKDLSRYGDLMTGNNDLDDGKIYDVKKEIYRLTDRAFAAMAKCYEIDASGTFAILDELRRKEIISSEARHNLASASAIAIKLRLSTYLEAKKQGEHLMPSSNEETGKLTTVYYMPNNEELFHFFFIAIPLYEELQKIKPAGNIPPSLKESSFFDDSDVTMGHIYCRLLNYDEALKCYDRTLQQDPENLSIEIRRISIALCITKGKEEMVKIREHLDILLCKIDQSWSELHQETTPFVNRLHLEGSRQLIEVLFSAFSLFDCLKYFKLAQNVLFQSLDIEGTKYMYSVRRKRFIMAFPFIKYFPEFFHDAIDSVTSALTYLIDEEGVSTKSILWLNRCGEFLYDRDKIDKAYRCFQRALSMEHLLYGTIPNVNVMTSLYFLGTTSNCLFMYRESEFYFKSLVQFGSYGGPTTRLMVKKAYLQLAFLSAEMGYSAEECRCYLEKGLKATTGNRNYTELKLDFFFYCELAVTWHAQHNQEKAWESVLNAKACQENIVGIFSRVEMSCWLAKTLTKIKETNKGIEMLKEEVQKLTSQSQTEEKALCLMKLGKFCVQQGLASDAENYYKQALIIIKNKHKEVVVDMQDNEDSFDILKCHIGISKANMMDNKVSEAEDVLYQAFILAGKLPASKKKVSFLEKIGLLYKNRCEIGRARQCFDEAVRTSKEESNFDKKLPIMQFRLEVRLGELAKNACAIIDSENPEFGKQVERSHYDRAAEILRQHVATEQDDSMTIDMLFSLAQSYKSVDVNEAVRLLLESLKVFEKAYGKNKSNEIVTQIIEEISDAYFLAADFQASIKYRELLIRMEMDVHLSNPFHKQISQNLTLLTFLSLDFPVSIDTVERAYEFFSSAQKDKASTDSTAKTVAARCFTCLGILFHTLGDLEKAETLITMASQLFSEIQEREKLPFKTTCDIIKKILPSQTISPSDKEKLRHFLTKAFFALRGQDTSNTEDLENRGNGREDVELFIPTSDDVKLREINSSDLKTMEHESNHDALLKPELSNLEVKRLLLRTQLDDLEHNLKKGNVHQAAKIYTSLQADELSFYGSCPFDVVETLISDAIRAKEDNKLSSGIRYLDIAVQLPSNWRQKSEILKLRGECYLSRGDFRTAAINFNEAAGIYSSETVENRDDLCEYSEVAIGLIKTEMLCQNVAGAWVECQQAIELVFNHKHGESVYLQEIELLYLGAKCLDILSDSAESKDDKLTQACSLCQQALLLHNEHKPIVRETLELEEFKLYLVCEVSLLLVAVLRKLHEEEQADKNLEGIAKRLTNGYEQFESAEPGFRKICPKSFRRLFSEIGRVNVERDEIRQSITWLSESLSVFFSAALPDMLSFFEEFLPLLQAITVTKSSGTSHESRSPFQQAVDMCKEVSLKHHGNDLNDVYEFLKTLANLYMGLGRTEEAIVVAETGLEICDFMGDNNVTDRINNRGRMLLYLAQMHQLNSTNSAFDRNKELNLAEHYYNITDQDSAAEFVLQKNISYANFLCEQKRFAEADAALQDMSNLGKELSNKSVYCAYSSRLFYGPGIQKSVEVDGELLSTVEHCMYTTMVRIFVGMGKKREAVAACEKLTANPIVVHDAIHGKRPSSMPYLIEACHRKLLYLLSDEDQKQLQNCELPLSPANIFKLYYMLKEYTLALKYYTNETQSPDLIEMKVSCLLVEMDSGDKSDSYFKQFLAMLQTKEEFLEKPFHAQCATLAGYSFANQYYIFRSLGEIMARERGNLEGAIQYFERCLELDEDFTLDQDLVASLAGLYQSKALTVDIENQDSCKRQMNRALNLFQKLLQKTAELTPFVECSFGSLLLNLERYDEAVERFENVIKREDDELMDYTDLHKPLVDVYLGREIEACGSIIIPVKVKAFYELILTYMKLNEVGKAQEIAHRLENYVKRNFQRTSECPLALSIVGYANKLIGNKEKAAEIFVSVLEIIPGHLCGTMVRVFVEMGKKKEAVAACEKLIAANPIVVHDAIHGKRPSSMPYLIEACHRELLALLSDEDQKQLQNCEFPLSSANIFKLYYMLNGYTLALKYYTNEMQSPDLIEMKISCLRLAGNKLVEMDRGKESHSYFLEFLAMLQTKEGFLDKPFHAQCATLARYSFANQYYIFRWLGDIMACERGNLDGAIQCYERCLTLDEDLTLDQSLVATLANLYQSKALTVDIENQDSCKRQMNLALNLFQKLLQKTAELTPFVECSFGSLLLKLERDHEAVEHFENVIKRADREAMECTDIDKPLFDVYLRREIEVRGSITIPLKVQAFYQLILTYMKLPNEVGKAEEVALRLENYVERFQRIPETSLFLSIVGYANKLIGNKEKAAKIFVSVLEIISGHLCSTLVRVFVEMGKKREAVAACEKLIAANPVVVHDAIDGKRPSCMPYLIEACHRELLSLLSDEDLKQLENCEFPLSPANIFKLYYMLNEYSLALKYYTNETADLIEMKISCLRLAGNELVEMDRGDESDSYFLEFLAMLQTKEGFLDKPFHTQCATLEGYSFANQYYIFRSLGCIIRSRGGNLYGEIKCYERCFELDENLAIDQGFEATPLFDLHQSLKTLRVNNENVNIENQDSLKRQMNVVVNLLQKLLPTIDELTPFGECWFGSCLLDFERYHEAVEHFENIIKREDDEPVVSVIDYTDVDKSLFDVYLHREVEVRGSIAIPVKVGAFYALILSYMKLNEVGKAQEVALRLEDYVELFQFTPKYSLILSTVGYANKVIGNKEKAAEIFVSVLEINPGHLPVTEALESLCV